MEKINSLWRRLQNIFYLTQNYPKGERFQPFSISMINLSIKSLNHQLVVIYEFRETLTYHCC